MLSRRLRLRRLTIVGLLWGIFLFGILVSLRVVFVDGSLDDLGAFLDSGRNAALGLNPYDGSGSYPNLNAPLSVLLFQALTAVDPVILRRVWFVLSLLTYLVCAYLITRIYPTQSTVPRLAWAVALPALWDTLAWGQVYTLLLLLVVAGWLQMEHPHYLLAGLLIGALVAIKPNFVVWPMLLFIGGYRRPAVFAVVASIMLGAVPALKYGPSIYMQWWTASQEVGLQIAGAWQNSSIVAISNQMGISKAGLPIAATLLAGIGLWTWLNRPNSSIIGGLALTSAQMASPIAWAGYELLLLPVFFGAQAWSRHLTAAAILFLIPVAYYTPVHPLYVALFGPMRLLALALVLVDLLLRQLRQAGRAGKAIQLAESNTGHMGPQPNHERCYPGYLQAPNVVMPRPDEPPTATGAQ